VIRYAWSLSMSATMPYPAYWAEMTGIPAVTEAWSSSSRPASSESFGISTRRGTPRCHTEATQIGRVAGVRDGRRST
jgi:hypothetical protein